MHASHLPLKVWFTALHILTSHSNGVSALQLQAQLGLGGYESAWLMLQKLRRAMVMRPANGRPTHGLRAPTSGEVRA